MKLVYDFREPIEDSFSDWNKLWQQALDKAVSEHKYPEIDYYGDKDTIKKKNT